MADDLMKALRAAGEHLDPVLRQQILASGDAAVGGLISILQDEELALAESAAQGWPPIHAVDLLAELGAVAAIATMLEAVRRGDIDDILSSRVAVRLPKLGVAILEPLLAEHSATEDPERLLVLSEMLSHIPVRDERVWLALSSDFERDSIPRSRFLARYGDERGTKLIESAVYGFDTPAHGDFALSDLRELVDAYEELAGALPDDLADHVEDLLDELHVPADVPAVSTKVGRNDPCTCGGGKKYKRCHGG
jgi:SEC-C motif